MDRTRIESPTAHTGRQTEHALALLWSEVLQRAALPQAHDNFFALGGDSMAMVMLEYRIEEELAVQLPMGSVVSAPTLRELSLLVDGMRGHSGSETPLSSHS